MLLYNGKCIFPKESFFINDISFYHKNLKDINYDSVLILKKDPDNEYDAEAIQILHNNNCIGYVPNNEYIKTMCSNNIQNTLKIINLKRKIGRDKFEIRVILTKYYTEDLKNIVDSETLLFQNI